jgi:nucleotide-binding universal stress UspA family protein
MKTSYPKRILLAVDLKAEDMTLTARLWEAVKPLVKAGTIIEPVSVLNREDLAIGALMKNRIGGLRSATERHLSDQLKSLGLKNLAAPKVLFANGSSTQRAVMALTNYAKKSSADLIAVSSHSRKGIKRFFLGSFAETLSLQSVVPVFVVNPAQRRTSVKSNVILFPTDLSDESRQGLEMACAAFADRKPKIVLFHSYLFPKQLLIEPFVSSPLPQSAIEDDYKRIKSVGEGWCKELRAKGFSCELVVDRKSAYVVEGVLSAVSRHKAGMVVMVSHVGRIGAALLGSVTRGVLRNCPRPVWVVHPTDR